MKTFLLHFESRTLNRYGRVVPFAIPIQACTLGDAHLVAERMRGEPTWAFVRAEEVAACSSD